MSILNKIKSFSFPEDQYYKQATEKKQICLHHTVSGGKAENVFISWTHTPERVATPIVIGQDGTIVQGYGCIYWAHHLGLRTVNNTILNKGCIGIELCSWGGLTFDGTNYLNAYGDKVEATEVFEIPNKFRGYRFFHKYTNAQIASLKELLLFLCDKYNITKKYNEDMWDISPKALRGDEGIFTHVSYRADKSDCFPQPELIEMLKSL